MPVCNTTHAVYQHRVPFLTSHDCFCFSPTPKQAAPVSPPFDFINGSFNSSHLNYYSGLSNVRGTPRLPLHEVHLSLTPSFDRSQQNTSDGARNGRLSSVAADGSGADLWVNPMRGSAEARTVSWKRK